MSRLNLKYTEEVIHPEERVKKVVIIDADSLPFICSYQPKKDKFGNDTIYYTKENGGYEIIEGFLNDKLLNIYNKIEEFYDISNIYLCVKGTNNPRKLWMPEYKMHRSEVSDAVKHLHNYLITNLNAYVAPIGEADDCVASIQETIKNEGIIVGIDKDLLSIKGMHYNYVKEIWTYIDYKKSRYNFWTQVLMGDSVDFKGTSPGIGIKYVEKVLNIDFTEEEYKKAVYNGFLKAWKGNEELAIKNMNLAHNLVKLWNIEELANFNMNNLDLSV